MQRHENASEGGRRVRGPEVHGESGSQSQRCGGDYGQSFARRLERAVRCSSRALRQFDQPSIPLKSFQREKDWTGEIS